jgi:prevent-host-death family protein
VENAININIYEAKTQLSALVEKAAQGQEIIIAKAGKPMARLAPLASPATAQPRVFGQNLLGIPDIAPDFDAPLPDDMLDSFYQEPVFPPSDAADKKR